MTTGPGDWATDAIARLANLGFLVVHSDRLRAVNLDAATAVVKVSSPAPILRWSGHSQGVDPLTDEVGAFFARLMIPIDYRQGAEASTGATPPLALYAAMLADAHTRLAGSRILREAQPGLDRFVARELARLRSDHPDALETGRLLLTDLGLDRAPTAS